MYKLVVVIASKGVLYLIATGFRACQTFFLSTPGPSSDFNSAVVPVSTPDVLNLRYHMTRTERAAYPRALERDRSSRTGLSGRIPKDGSGGHNWGNEVRLLYDEGNEFAEEVMSNNDDAGLGRLAFGSQLCLTQYLPI